MRVKHANYVKKIICPLCRYLVSNKSNLRVHAKRYHQRKQKKINDLSAETIWVRRSLLMNGRYYGALSSHKGSEDGETEEQAISASSGSEALNMSDSDNAEPMHVFMRNRNVVETSSSDSDDDNTPLSELCGHAHRTVSPGQESVVDKMDIEDRMDVEENEVELGVEHIEFEQVMLEEPTLYETEASVMDVIELLEPECVLIEGQPWTAEYFDGPSIEGIEGTRKIDR